MKVMDRWQQYFEDLFDKNENPPKYASINLAIQTNNDDSSISEHELNKVLLKHRKAV